MLFFSHLEKDSNTKKWVWVVCKVDTLRWRWLLTLSLRLESILDPGLCGDNHLLITVIYLLVGQDNSCSAGDVDLREKEKERQKGGKKVGRKERWQLKINDVNENTDFGNYWIFRFILFFVRNQTWRHLVVPWWSGASHNKGRLNEEEEKEKEDGEGEDGGVYSEGYSDRSRNITLQRRQYTNTTALIEEDRQG